MPFTVQEVRGIEPHPDTNPNETNVSELFAVVNCTGTIGSELEDFPFGLIPPDKGANANIVRVKLQEWLNAGGEIPEWVPPTAEEQRATVAPLSRRQFRRGLLKAGQIIPGKPKITSADIEATIAAIPDETTREEAEIDWQDAAQFERLNPLVVTLSSALGFTPEEVDTLWQAALQI